MSSARGTAPAVFSAARQGNFAAIRAYAAVGNSVNVCDAHGNSLLAVFLDAYEAQCAARDEPLLPAHPEWDYEFSFVPETHKTPLEARQDGIFAQLEWFLAQGADLNLCDLSACGAVETPLFVAVQFADYYLLEYLLKHGADPRVRLSDSTFPWETEETYLTDHVDVLLMDARGARTEYLYRLGALLERFGAPSRRLTPFRASLPDACETS